MRLERRQSQVEALARLDSARYFYLIFFFCHLFDERRVQGGFSRALVLMNEIRCGTPLVRSFAQASGVVSEPIFTSSLQCWHVHVAPRPLDRGVASSLSVAYFWKCGGQVENQKVFSGLGMAFRLQNRKSRNLEPPCWATTEPLLPQCEITSLWRIPQARPV